MLFLQTTSLTRNEIKIIVPHITALKGSHDFLIEKRKDIPFYDNNKVKLFIMDFIKYACLSNCMEQMCE